MLRGDYAEPWMFGLKSAQATSLGFFLVALGFFIYCGWLENISLLPKKKLSAKNLKIIAKSVDKKRTFRYNIIVT